MALSLWEQFFAAAASTSCSVVFTNPMDTVKTRLQLQGELSAAQVKYRGLFHALSTIAREEGVWGLQKGLAPAVGFQIAMNGTRLGMYEPAKAWLGETKHATGPIETARRITAGAAVGIAGAFLGNPFYVVKTRLQAQSHSFDSLTKHTIGGLWHGFETIIKREGVKGLFRGADASMLRVAVGSSVQLTTYDSVKATIVQTGWIQQGLLLHTIAAFAAGIGITIGMNPFDVVNSRMCNQTGALYTSPWDCFVKTVRSEGFFALYKGSTALYARLGPHTVLGFVFLEQFRKLLMERKGSN